MPENLIEDTIGTDAYLALCDWTGGVNYYVPSDATTDKGQELDKAIGTEAAGKLIAWAGSSVLYVPNRFSAELMRRQRAIMTMRANGMTAQEIARKFRYDGRYTERQIWRVMTLKREEILYGETVKTTPDLFM